MYLFWYISASKADKWTKLGSPWPQSKDLSSGNTYKFLKCTQDAQILKNVRKNHFSSSDSASYPNKCTKLGSPWAQSKDLSYGNTPKFLKSTQDAQIRKNVRKNYFSSSESASYQNKCTKLGSPWPQSKELSYGNTHKYSKFTQDAQIRKNVRNNYFFSSDSASNAIKCTKLGSPWPRSKDLS